MDINRRQQSEVLFGDQLLPQAPQFTSTVPSFSLAGRDKEGDPVFLPINVPILSKHILLLGGTGTGKTNTFFQLVSSIQKRMSTSDVMVIFDTKGDFYEEFYVPGDVVISNDETATGSRWPDYWNIFEELPDDDRLMENVIEISKAIFAEACEKTTQIFFPNAARDIFMALIVHMVRTLPKEKRTNKNLVTLINGASVQDLRQILNSHDEFRAMVSYIAADDSPQTQGVLSELQQVAREVFVGNFAQHGNLGIRSLVNQKGAKKIFIEYDLSIGDMLAPVYSLLFDLAIKEALGRKRAQGSVYFVVDEFNLLPYLRHIDDAVNFGRGLGIKLMVGVQNVEQIYDAYGEERGRCILSGLSTSISFRVNDAKSREYIQGLYGKNQKLDSYLPTNQKNGIVETQREANVVEDWDIYHLNLGEAIIGLPGHQPFVFRFEEYVPIRK